jgi:hypothetical protein
VPVVAVSVEPDRAVPLISGTVTLVVSMVHGRLAERSECVPVFPSSAHTTSFTPSVQVDCGAIAKPSLFRLGIPVGRS